MFLNVKNAPFNVKIKQLVDFSVFRRKKTIKTIGKRCAFLLSYKRTVCTIVLKGYFAFVGIQNFNFHVGRICR